jgi:multidrug resistance efflux pump
MTDEEGENSPEAAAEIESVTAAEEPTGASQVPAEEGALEDVKAARDPVRMVTIGVLLLALLFFGFYVRADRVMPFTTQARVSGYTVPIVPQVSGYISSIGVGLHEVVQAGEVLVEIDTLQFQIGVRSARAALDNAILQLDGADAAVAAAAAGVAAARAQEDITRRDLERLEAIRDRDPTAISRADLDRSEAAHLGAAAAVEASEADLRRARAALGPAGDDNPVVRSALAALEQAELNLARATVHAPSAGAIETLFLDVGFFAGAGQPLMTFVSTADIWISADLRENNLENLAPGNPVQVLLDVNPGRVYRGQIRSIGLGVGGTMPRNRGDLPAVGTQSGWLRQPQQFPVVIDLVDEVDDDVLRIGAQATVMVFTGDHPILNPIGRALMRLNAVLSYLR